MKMKFALTVFVVAGLILVHTGCAKIDILPQLEITVLDDSGAVVPGADAALFSSADDWNKRLNPVQAWRRSDAAGKVVFVDLKEITYYIYIRSLGKDNSLNEVFTTEPLQKNHKDQLTVHLR